MNYKSFKKGDEIIKEGTQETCAYMLESGKLEVSSMASNKKVVYAILSEKQIFGEMSLMDDAPRAATVTALEDTLVSVIDRDEFNKQLRENPETLFPIMKSLFERLRTVNKGITAKHGLTLAWNKNKNTSKAGLITFSGLNETSIKSMGGKELKVNQFPFKVGRRSESNPDVLSDNDLSLDDFSGENPSNLSTNHFLVDIFNKKYVVIDRGSSLGTIVNGTKINEPCILNQKVNAIVVGSVHSPFAFKLEIDSA